jgi:diacylglycerol kinase (ATP)
MQKFTRFHHISFKHAFNGVVYAFKTQPNFKVHTFIYLLTLFLAYYLNISYIEVLVIFLISALVFSLEMINTAIEALSDQVSGGEWKELIKVAKDCSSGAVLIASIFAVVIGLIIFLPRVF